MVFKINIPDKTTANPYNLVISKFEIYNFEYTQNPSQDNKTDISLMVKELNIFESIYSNFMEAEVIIDDAVGLFTQFPIIGDETVHVEMQSPHENFYAIKLKMRIVALKELTRHKSRLVSYHLKMVSEESLRDAGFRISRAYGPKEVSEIVKDIFNGKNDTDPKKLKVDWTDKLLEVHDSEGQRQIAFPFMNPMKAINYLSKEAKEKNQDISNYYFYEDHDGFNFKNINTLLKSEPVEIFFFTDVKNINAAISTRTLFGIDTGIPLDFRVIDSFSIKGLYDFEKMLTSGYLASSLMAIDPNLQTVEQHTYQYGDDFNKFNHTSKGKDLSSLKIIRPDNSYYNQVDPNVNTSNMLTNKNHAQKYNIFPSIREDMFNKKLAADEMMKFIIAEMTVPRKHVFKATDKK